MKLLEIFSLPSYLRIPAVGIDISDRSIKYVELQKRGKELSLKKFGERKIEEGIIESGMIKKKDILVAHLKEIKKELGNNYIISSLPEEKAYLKVVWLPKMEKEQIRKSLELQMEEVIPLPPAEALFDYEICDNADNKDERLGVVLTAFPVTLAEEYLESFKLVGFFPIAFEVENQAMARALIPSGEKNASMIVDFGRTKTSFMIFEGGLVKFTSTIPIAGESINKSLARSLKIDVFEAERLKQEKVASGKIDEKLQAAVAPVVAAIKEEIEHTLEYWRTHAEERGVRNKDVDKIIFCGGDSNFTGLTDYFSSELKKPAELGNPWINVASFENYIPEMEKRQSLAYATAIGLALRSFQNIFKYD